MKKGSGNQAVATTMATVRTFKELLRDKNIGPRLVPIIPDEARTFGMDSWFPSLKIYNRNGQLYTSVDSTLMLAYKESEIGQILHEGINEAGSTSSFTAVGTSYSTHNEPMIPIYIFYSMFGFQRTGDGLWAAADQMAKGFVLGATAGRTTLTGEGLQHADGHSLLLASDQPGRGDLRPGVRLRDRPHHRERPAADVRRARRERVLLHHHLQRALRATRGAGRSGHRGAVAGYVPLPPRARTAHEYRPDPGLGRVDARGVPRAARHAGRAVGRGGRRVVGDQLG